MKRSLERLKLGLPIRRGAEWRRSTWLAGIGIAISGLATLAGGCPANDNGAAPDDNPLLALTAEDHVVGDPAARVTVIEYGDFQCPVCGRFARETYPTVGEDYIATGRVRWVYRHFPLRSVHPDAEAAAQASECAAAQARFWDYHDVLFTNQAALGAEDLNRYADELGLAVAAFDECRSSGLQTARVQRDVASGQALGVTGTPTFFINGRRETGFRSVSVFRALLDAAEAGR
jgi:protein-disulfide isomerase